MYEGCACVLIKIPEYTQKKKEHVMRTKQRIFLVKEKQIKIKT